MIPIDPEFFSRLTFNLINGLVWALIIALIALGLSLIFGLMQIVNLAHGDFYMLGATLTLCGLTIVGNFGIGIVITLIVIGFLGLGIERSILRPVEGMVVNTVIVTIGLSYIIQQVTLAVFGGVPLKMPNPFPITIEFLGVNYPAYRIIVAGASCLALLVLWVFLFKTSYGLWIRASMQDREMANAMGVSVNRVYLLTFSLGMLLAALGGALASPIVQVFYLMGFDILAISFIVVIVGGLGSLKGTFIAALIMVPFENLMALFVTPTEARVLSFIIMAIILLKRPRGLFGVW